MLEFYPFLKQRIQDSVQILQKQDLEILEKLIKDPRQKIEQIAKNTNMSTKTITRCIEKLYENDGIQFTSSL